MKYPHIQVKLSGKDGNAYSILGNVTAAMKKAGVSKEDRDSYMKEATSGDYNNLLYVTGKWVDIR